MSVAPPDPERLVETHLERQSRADLVLQDLGNRAVEVGQDLHGELGIDVVLRDQVVEGICERTADTARRGTRGDG